MTAGAASQPIEIRLAAVAQLFHTLDPVPFREGDLSEDAERYIVEWAEELPARLPFAIRVHLPPAEAASPAARAVPDAIRQHFDRRAQGESRLIQQNFRAGRLALAIGLAILACCLFLAVTLVEEPAGGVGRVLQESLVILGWVAMWRPCEILLYDWLPMAQRRRLFRRLAAASVSVTDAAMVPQSARH